MPGKNKIESEPNSGLPDIGVKILVFLLPARDREAVVGDVEEEFRNISAACSRKKTALWFWYELVKAVPVLSVQLLKDNLKRTIMEEYSFWGSGRTLAALGFVSILPAVLFIGVSVLKYYLGWIDSGEFVYRYSHPVIILGGLMASAAFNIKPLLKIKLCRDVIGFEAKFHLRGRLLNAAVLLVSFIAGSIIFLYLLAENFRIFA